MLIPAAQRGQWHAQASAVPGLNHVERKVLDAIREWYRRLYEQFDGSLSHARMARGLDVDPVQVRWVVNRLIELGVVAVKPGAGGRANLYLPALPKRLAASLALAAVEDDDAPPF